MLPAVIEAFKRPADDRRTRPTRCRVLDGRYDVTRGVVAVVQVVDGSLREGDRTAFLGGDGKEHTVQELGLLTPAHHRTGFLNAGCVGYLVPSRRLNFRVGVNVAARGAVDTKETPSTRATDRTTRRWLAFAT